MDPGGRSFAAVALVSAFFVSLAPAYNQSAGPSVRKIYVDSIADSNHSGEIRKLLLAAVRKEAALTLVENRQQADAVLEGKADIWVQGYYSLNPRDRSLSNAHAVYRGYLSVELKGKDDETIWSYLATPRSAGSEDIRKNLAQQVAKKLAQSVIAAKQP